MQFQCGWRVFVAFFLFVATLVADSNRLSFLDHLDPYYVSRDVAKLTCPQWVGEPGVDCVVVLAIDDMRDPKRYEQYLRPILNRLKQIDGRAPVSIMTNQVDPDDPQLQTWLDEGLSIEVHTIDHPCPLLCDGDFSKAKATYDRCVDLMNEIDGNTPVAFRMPCCDSQNTPSPRFWAEIFESTTDRGHALSIDSSVFNIIDENDGDVTKEIAFDESGRRRFRKYLPFPSFVNTIENYPYPYVIGRTCWEFPCVVPSDWEAQNLHRPNNPQTVIDMKAALDAVVQQQGVYNLVFHPHGWIRADQINELISYADSRYGKRVKFLTFRECLERINNNLLDGHPLRAATNNQGKSITHTRLIDVDGDGYQDVLRVDPDRHLLITRIWDPRANSWRQTSIPWNASVFAAGVIESPAASLVFAEHDKPGLHVITMRNGTWQRTDSIHTADGVVDHLILRDLDGDGICEIIAKAGSKQPVVWRYVDGEQKAWKSCPYTFPPNVVFSEDQPDALRFYDIDQDGDLDCIYSDASQCSVHLFESHETGWSTAVLANTRADGDATIPPFVRVDGSNNGAWFHSGFLWFQNEDTSRMPDNVDRRRLSSLLHPNSNGSKPSVFPPARTPKGTLASITTSQGVTVELVASEPLIEDPVAFDWGMDGSLWVAEMHDYPNGIDGKGTPGGKIKHLIDTDNDGQYDQATLFADGLPFPNGVKTWRDGILVTAAPDILFLQDTDNDGKADKTTIYYSGFSAGNQQHRANGLVWGFDGWLYVANGESGGAIFSRKLNKSVQIGGRDVRIRPDDGDIEVVAGPTQFGRTVNLVGDWFGGNNSYPIWHYALDDHYQRRNPHYSGPSPRRSIQEVPGAAPVFPTSALLPRFNDFDRANRFTSACSPEIYRDDKIGAPGGTFYVCEPVHNLVHREEILPDGLSYRTRRLPSEEHSEFFASSDNWCRPVMVRTGPDGCLWIADMYRLVIEHPEWIPRTWQEQVDLRAGADMGRIYRVRPERASSIAEIFRTPLGQLSTPQLTRLFEQSNGPLRDMAQQLLLWRKAPQTEHIVRDLLSHTDKPIAKIYGLHTLNQLGSLNASDILQAIGDANHHVARHGIRLSEPFLNMTPTVGEAIVRRMESLQDLHPLHQQAAYTLGYWKDKRGAAALAALANRFNDRYLTASILSSINRHNIANVIESAIAQLSTTPNLAHWNEVFVAEIIRESFLLDDSEATKLAVELFRKLQPIASRQWLFATYGEISSTVANRQGLVPREVQQALQQIAKDLGAAAQQVAMAETNRLSDRIAAVRLLLSTTSPDHPLWEQLLDSQFPPELNIEVADAIVARTGSARRLFQKWETFSPLVRSEILDRVVRRADTTKDLLTAIENGLVSPKDVGIVRQQQLKQHEQSELQKRIQRLFGKSTENERGAIVERYLGELEEGNAAQGAVVFRKHCSVCHRLDSIGNEIGPDLAALSDKSPIALLTAILDPNRSIEERYVSYTIHTKDGLVFTGIIREETTNAITLFTADGKQQTVLRKDIDSIISNHASLMPVGFEKELSPGDMSDLLSYLQQQSIPRKRFPGNEPRLAPMRDDGSIRLFAMHARIYGPSIVFEDRYRNLGFWSSPNDRAIWDLEIPEDRKYDVAIEYACSRDTAGNRFLLTIGDQILSGTVRSTDTWDDYQWHSLGTIDLRKGRTTATLRSAGPIEGFLMDCRTILLEPK